MSTKLRIAILGSTGRIGCTAIDIVRKFPKKFSVELISFDKNYKLAIKQAKKFNPKFIYTNNEISYRNLKKVVFKKNIKIINDFNLLKKKLKTNKKFDKVILGVNSINGLEYAFNFIKYSKGILVANKESIVCGGKLFLDIAKLYKCKITSIDSEHYCISELIKDNKISEIDKIYLTASGGPFLNIDKNKYYKANIKDVTNHPKWNMGKKISVDSATMVNKILEVIEAHVLFKLSANKIKIKIHKESLVHGAVVFKNGLVKMIMHDTSMIIPIRNSMFDGKYSLQKKNDFFNKKNFSLTFDETNLKKYKILKTGYDVLKLGHRAWILFNVINDTLVEKFLKEEIFFYEIVDILIKMFSQKKIKLYCKQNIKQYSDIVETINYGKNLLIQQ